VHTLRFKSVVAVVVVMAASVAGYWFGNQRRAASAVYRVIDVLDGDTIVVLRGHTRDTIRLLGVDTSNPC
jgi:endonuclease YncB( thermonuclease family)